METFFLTRQREKGLLVECAQRLVEKNLAGEGKKRIRNWQLISLLLLLLMLGNTACSASNGPSVIAADTDELGNLIAWIENADPEKDAATAINASDGRLFALALRGASVPGVDADDRQKYIDKCGVKFVQGVDDVIRNADDLRYLALAREYALAYNKVVLGYCETGR